MNFEPCQKRTLSRISRSKKRAKPTLLKPRYSRWRLQSYRDCRCCQRSFTGKRRRLLGRLEDAGGGAAVPDVRTDRATIQYATESLVLLLFRQGASHPFFRQAYAIDALSARDHSHEVFNQPAGARSRGFGIAPPTVQDTLSRLESAGFSWSLPEGRIVPPGE
jgi:hypothetical protein